MVWIIVMLVGRLDCVIVTSDGSKMMLCSNAMHDGKWNDFRLESKVMLDNSVLPDRRYWWCCVLSVCLLESKIMLCILFFTDEKINAMNYQY